MGKEDSIQSKKKAKSPEMNRSKTPQEYLKNQQQMRRKNKGEKSSKHPKESRGQCKIAIAFKKNPSLKQIRTQME